MWSPYQIVPLLLLIFFLLIDHVSSPQSGPCVDFNFVVRNYSNKIEANTLDLSNYGIQDIPEEGFRKFKNIVSLNLSMNQLKNISPRIIKKNKFLQTLDLSNNNLEKFPAINSDSLLHLDLSNNRIPSMPNTVLGDLPFLKSLNLSGNRLQQIDGASLSHKLKVLDLSHNRILQVRYKDYANLYALEELHLQGNSICEIDSSNFKQNHRLDKLFVSGNPWNCDNLTVVTDFVIFCENKTTDVSKIYCEKSLESIQNYVHHHTEPETNIKLWKRIKWLLGCAVVLFIILCIIFFYYCRNRNYRIGIWI